MNEKDTNAPAIEPEQAAMLATLENEAAGEAPIPGTPEAIAAEEAASRPPVNLADEFDGLLEVMLAPAGKAVPELAEIWTDKKRRESAEAIADVFNKRGWLQDGVFGGAYKEEIIMLVTVAPPAWASFWVIKAAIAKAQESAKAAPMVASAMSAAS